MSEQPRTLLSHLLGHVQGQDRRGEKSIRLVVMMKDVFQTQVEAPEMPEIKGSSVRNRLCRGRSEEDGVESKQDNGSLSLSLVD